MKKIALLGNANLITIFKIIARGKAVITSQEKADYIVLLQYNKIIHRIRKPTINLHFSLLPKYRGMYPVYFAVRNGDNRTGITWHMINKGIDTGDIVYQRGFKIEPCDTCEIVYNKCVLSAVKTMPDILRILEHGIKPRPQNIGEICQFTESYNDRHSVNFSDTYINPYDSDAYNRTRALIFPKYQLPRIRVNNLTFYISKVEKS